MGSGLGFRLRLRLRLGLGLGIGVWARALGAVRVVLGFGLGLGLGVVRVVAPSVLRGEEAGVVVGRGGLARRAPERVLGGGEAEG